MLQQVIPVKTYLKQNSIRIMEKAETFLLLITLILLEPNICEALGINKLKLKIK